MTEYDDITGLIERSSLGTPAARALRALTPRWVVAEILRRAAQLEEQSYTPPPVGSLLRPVAELGIVPSYPRVHDAVETARRRDGPAPH
jgi:hypothetical protein